MESSTDVIITGDAVLITICSVFAILNATAGLAASRQWTLIPLAVGLPALIAFLLNPLADRSSTEELRALLMTDPILTLVCSVQLLQSVITAWCLIRIAGDSQNRRWPVLLGSVCCITPPVLACQLLLLEHWYLLSVQNSRPESTGLWMGLAAATLSLLLMLLFLWTPRERLLKLALSASLLSTMTSIVLSAAGQSLPAIAETGVAVSLTEISVASIGVLLVITAGFLFSARRSEFSP